MSLHSTPRTSVLRRGLVALATATTLLAGGLVVAPAAQAFQIPVVDVDSRGGTVVKTRMHAWGSVIEGNVKTDKLSSAEVRYQIDLDWSGGDLRSFYGEVTLQRAGAKQVRRIPVSVDIKGNRSGKITLPGTLTPGSYRVGIEYTAQVKRADGRSIRHTVDVNNAETVSVRRQTVMDASITNPRATDGRPSRITGRVRVLSVSSDGDVYWSTLQGGVVHLGYDPDGPMRTDAEDVQVRTLTIDRHGKFSTVVPARDRMWVVSYPGTTQLDPIGRSIIQGPDRGCGC